MNKTYKVCVIPSVSRELKKVSKQLQSLLVERIMALADEPFPPDVEKVKDAKYCYRFREGDYRVVYAVMSDESLIHIMKVGHRGEVYRDMVSDLNKKIRNILRKTK